MWQQDVELARRGVEHLMPTGEPFWKTLDEEVRIHDHDTLDAHDDRGRAGWAGYGGLREWEAAWSLEAEEFIDADDDHVILCLAALRNGTRSGVKLERQDAVVFTMRAGKTVRNRAGMMSDDGCHPAPHIASKRAARMTSPSTLRRPAAIAVKAFCAAVTLTHSEKPTWIVTAPSRGALARLAVRAHVEVPPRSPSGSIARG